MEVVPDQIWSSLGREPCDVYWREIFETSLDLLPYQWLRPLPNDYKTVQPK